MPSCNSGKLPQSPAVPVENAGPANTVTVLLEQLERKPPDVNDPVELCSRYTVRGQYASPLGYGRRCLRADSWPAATETGWSVGNDPENGKYWDGLDRETPDGAGSALPKLWRESDDRMRQALQEQVRLPRSGNRRGKKTDFTGSFRRAYGKNRIFAFRGQNNH